MILAAIFLKHKLRLWKIMAAVVLTGGILLVVQPPFMFGDQESQSQNATKNGSSIGIFRDNDQSK